MEKHFLNRLIVLSYPLSCSKVPFKVPFEQRVQCNRFDPSSRISATVIIVVAVIVAAKATGGQNR